MTAETAPTAAPARVVRASMFAVLCVSLSAFGHGVTSGRAPSLSTLTLAMAALTAFAWLGTDRRCGPATIIAGLTVGQALLHMWFSIDPSNGHMAHLAAESTSAGPGAMVAAHVVAAVGCGLWLWWGERTVFELVRIVIAWARPLLLVLLPGNATSGRLRAAVIRPPGWRDPLRHSQVRRGPPSLSFRVSESTLAA